MSLIPKPDLNSDRLKSDSAFERKDQPIVFSIENLEPRILLSASGFGKPLDDVDHHAHHDAHHDTQHAGHHSYPEVGHISDKGGGSGESSFGSSAQLLPDLFPWASESRGYLYDYVIEGNLLRFSTAFANQGEGHLEIFGGDVLPNGNQEVWQRIYHDDGSTTERLAGEFTYHTGHGHIHFDGYAIYNLRANVDGNVGDIVATGGKISFCLIDITRYDPNAGPSNYGSCGQLQGVSAGWSDVYSRGLPDQFINITGIDDGDYFLEVIVDPLDQLLESDETNNTTVIPITINGGPGDNGDSYEPNDTFVTASNFGIVSHRTVESLSIHEANDQDYFQVVAAEDGNFHVDIEFTDVLGNLDLFVYDAQQNLIDSSTSNSDLESIDFSVVGGETYYILVNSVGSDTNGYVLNIDGPGDFVTITVHSDDVPVDIPDGAGANTPGPVATSFLIGPDLTLTDVNLNFDDLTHSWLGDLHIELESPNGTLITVLTSQWESGGGLLGSEDNFFGTILDSQAPTNLGEGSAPFTGSYNIVHANVGNDPFNAFNGEISEGVWTVRITDWYSADSGSLNAWSITFTGIDNNPGDHFEQNDAFPQATDFGLLGFVEETGLSIHNSTDVDFYRFMASANSEVDINLSFIHDLGNLDVIVFDSNQQEIARGDTINDDESLTVDVQANEVYFVQVLGIDNATNDYSMTIDVIPVIGESGLAGGISESWKTVNLINSYVDPVVVITPLTMADVDPAIIQIRNVTSNSFDVRMDLWEYQGSGHEGEKVGFVVVERGVHVLEDGTTIVAGVSNSIDGSWSNVSFGHSFAGTPVVVSQVASTNESDAAISRLHSVNNSGFSLGLQEEESSDGIHGNEDVHWIAMDVGTGQARSTLYASGLSTTENIKFSIQYGVNFADQPLLLGATQTINELDPFILRTIDLRTFRANFYMQEETSLDAEYEHLPEEFGFMAFGEGFIFGSRSQPDSWSYIQNNPDLPKHGSSTSAVELDRSMNDVVFAQRFSIEPIDRAGDMPIVERLNSVTAAVMNPDLTSNVIFENEASSQPRLYRFNVSDDPARSLIELATNMELVNASLADDLDFKL